MNTRNVVLWLHILAGFLTLGPLILFDVVGPMAVRRRDAAAARFLHTLAGRLGPMTLLIPVLGLALVAEGGYRLSDRWIVAALVVYALMVANGIGLIGRNLGLAADRLEAGEDVAAALSRMLAFGGINIVLFLVALWLMVAKPGM